MADRVALPLRLSSSSAREAGRQLRARPCRCRARPRSSGSANVVAAAAGDKECWLLDYGAGNVRSVRNAIKHLGYKVNEVRVSLHVNNSIKKERYFFIYFQSQANT